MALAHQPVLARLGKLTQTARFGERFVGLTEITKSMEMHARDISTPVRAGGS
jgi:hypothetical protein